VLRLLHGLPLFAGLLLLDQVIKVAALSLLGAENPFAGLPVVALVAQLNAGTLFGFGAGVGDAMRWPAVVVGVVLVGLLWLGGRADRASEGAEGNGWWLCATGVIGNLVDRIWFGGGIEFLHLNLGPVTLSLNLADLLFASGLVLLTRDTVVRMTTPRHSQVPLSKPPEVMPDLSSLPRGIDNVRIDVRLSPQFEAAARRLISSLLYQHIGHERYGAKPTPPSRQEFTDFRTAYTALIGAVVRLAKQEQRPYPVMLTQLSVLKFIGAEVTREFDVQIGHLRGILGSDVKGGRKMLLHEHITALAQRRRAIELQARIQLSDEVKRVETGPGVKLRESLLGTAWVIDESVLFNPLLAAGDPQDPQVAMRHYVLLGKRTADWDALTRFEAYVERLVSRALPEGGHGGAEKQDGVSWLAGSDWAARAEMLGLGQAAGEIEHNPLTDVPVNADILFNANFLDAWLDEVRREGDAKTERQLRAQRRLQHLALERVYRFVRREGLLLWITAAYELVPVYREYYTTLNPLMLVQYLATGGRQRRNTLQQIRKAMRTLGTNAPSLKPLQQLDGRLQRMNEAQERHHISNFIRDFLAYRRDLRNFYLTQGVLEQVRLLEEPDEIRLSRVNNCLHEFLSGEEDQPKHERIRGHAVVKADLRGSTTITRQLLEQGLNPATHFDHNFFAPIRDVLRTFGAEKVFVEGDAIIATTLEYADDVDTHLPVARACALAQRMVGIADAHNRILETVGLPQLQIGIGVAFSADSPTYLFDGEQQIMISSAIGRADRLSSSSWRLRELAELREADARRVRVYELASDHPLRGEKGENHLRYNVLGVELEAAGFEKLKSEIDLRRIEISKPGSRTSAVFHVGKAPDIHGAIQNLVLRESRVQLFGLDGEGDATGELYYEVVTDPRVLGIVERQGSTQASELDVG
jgi:lipoprotein signal peptidase